MSTLKITENIWAVGVLNPNLRIFDIIMTTDFGTSYNAYLIKGEKVALVETVHANYYDEYIENIESILPLSSIDYIIMNHNEPDHSGSIAKLMQKTPNAQIITSQAGAIYLKNITNEPSIQIKAIKDGDKLDLGKGIELNFINAPFLHWPDSMFTWIPSQKILFSCDFLGTHYCEPRYLDRHISYMDKYDSSFKGYFDAIFGPFKPYVQIGLQKIKGLDLDYVCTSHGPILSKGNQLENAINSYDAWSQPVQKSQLSVPIFYCSAYGCTEKLAEKIKTGIADVLPLAEINIYNLNDYKLAELAQKLNMSDAFLIGSPTINRDAVAPAWLLATSIDAITMKGKLCTAFGSFGWSGEAVPMLLERLKGLKLTVFGEGFKAFFVPSEDELKKAFEFGKEFAQKLK